MNAKTSAKSPKVGKLTQQPAAKAPKVPAKRAASGTKQATRKTSAKAASTKAASTKAAKRAQVPARQPEPASETISASERITKCFSDLGGWRGERLTQIRALIRQVDPDVVEEWKWMGTAVWSHQGMYALANPHKDKVKITFFHGAKLKDPGKLFNNGLGGNKWRAIDLREADKLNEPAFKALLREAVAYNTTHAVPKSKGSRAELIKPKPGEQAPAKAPTMQTPKQAPKAAKQTPRKDTKAAAQQPKLLSGGNPQIPKGDGDAPVQAYIASMPGWKQDAGRRLDALIVRAVPGVRKAVRWNSPFYGVEGQGWFVSFHCFNKYVKVTFLRGTALTPLPPIASKDPNTRYLHVHEDGVLDEKQFNSWLKQASKLPGDPLF